jgi:hypothetical protein
MDAKPGFGQGSEITVSGQLFGYGPPPWLGSQDNPNIPPVWLALGDSGANVEISLGKSRASVHYRLSPPTLSVSGSAWVSPSDGELNAEIKVGQTSRFALAEEDVQLSIIAKDITTGAETPSDEITVPASAKTDEDGKIKLPLTAKTNPCELEKKATFFIKVTSSSIKGEQKIPIDLDCIGDLRFNIEEDAISLVQGVDLSDHPLRLAAGKEAGVRVYYGVEGEIYQPVNKPVTFNVKFDLLQTGTSRPLITQLKKVSLTENGVSVAWADPKKAVNEAGIGEVTKWEEKPTEVEGTDLTHIDFVFIPLRVDGKDGKFQIRITLDPEEVYGDKIKREIQGTVYNMKTLRLIIVPVDVYDMDMNFVLEQTSFLFDAYPLGLSNQILDLRDIYTKDQIPTSCTSMTYLKEIACGVGAATGIGGDSNNMTTDAQGRWWHQDPKTGIWSTWNGSAWIRTTHAPPQVPPPVIPRGPASPPAYPKPKGGNSCLITLVIVIILGVLVVGGISLVAFDILPVGDIQPGAGEISAMITRRAVVEDEWELKREKRGCSAVMHGLWSSLFGLLLLVGGLSLMTLALYQEVLPWLGF